MNIEYTKEEIKEFRDAFTKFTNFTQKVIKHKFEYDIETLGEKIRELNTLQNYIMLFEKGNSRGDGPCITIMNNFSDLIFDIKSSSKIENYVQWINNDLVLRYGSGSGSPKTERIRQITRIDISSIYSMADEMSKEYLKRENEKDIEYLESNIIEKDCGKYFLLHLFRILKIVSQLIYEKDILDKMIYNFEVGLGIRAPQEVILNDPNARIRSSIMNINTKIRALTNYNIQIPENLIPNDSEIKNKLNAVNKSEVLQTFGSIFQEFSTLVTDSEIGEAIRDSPMVKEFITPDVVEKIQKYIPNQVTDPPNPQPST